MAQKKSGDQIPTAPPPERRQVNRPNQPPTSGTGATNRNR